VAPSGWTRPSPHRIPHIHAVGDAIEVVDRVASRRGPVPLAGPANRQGRALADALFGGPAHTGAVQGTAIVRVFGLTAAVTGANERVLRAAGMRYAKVHLHPNDHAGYFPGAHAIHLKVLFDPEDGRILGAQAVGEDGVDKRIDVLATALRAGLDVEDLTDLELAYAPPFGSAKDPVNLAGMLASNVRAGLTRFWYPEDLDSLPDDAVVLDVRSAKEFAAGHLPGALNVPHTEVRDRLAEVPADRPLRLYCLSGFRSYLAGRVLQQEGWTDVATLAGGVKTLELALPGALVTD
jgi:rhodanese-related sulfurtransferase